MNHICGACMSLTFETRVAAAVTAQNPNLIRQEFSRVLGLPAATEGRMRHRLAFREVLYFKLKGSLDAAGVVLKPEDRRLLYRALQRKQTQSGTWRRIGRKVVRCGDVPLTFDLSQIVKTTHVALREYRKGADLIEARPEVCAGESVFKGTRVPLAQVVEQFRRGVPLAEIAADYPPLTERALRYAQILSRLGNAPGRPAKALTIRRIAREATDR